MIKPFILPALLLVFLPLSASAAPPMRGPLPEEQQQIIAEMAKRHLDFKRVVEVTKDGYQATTTTADKDLAAKLKSHLKYMSARLDSKAMVRRWDPAFVELVEYYDQLDTKITELEDGVRVVVTGKNANAVKVAQNHAKIVTGFTKEGDKAVEREHEPALAKPEANPEKKNPKSDKVEREVTPKVEQKESPKTPDAKGS
jgi:uncharacterized protein YdcH (DUF465 family)